MTASRDNTMTRNILIFLGTFVAGAFIALVGRAALHKPRVAVSEHAAPERAQMVSNPLTPDGSATTATGAGTHGAHAAATTKPAGKEAVNSVCAICGMNVDPQVPTLEYQGKTIGFGCKMCAPKFKADPDKYGPIYLRNEVIKR